MMAFVEVRFSRWLGERCGEPRAAPRDEKSRTGLVLWRGDGCAVAAGSPPAPRCSVAVVFVIGKKYGPRCWRGSGHALGLLRRQREAAEPPSPLPGNRGGTPCTETGQCSPVRLSAVGGVMVVAALAVPR